jgi:poly-gamma-glutamate synthesis protein (capsule biosynthesis protein)
MFLILIFAVIFLQGCATVAVTVKEPVVKTYETPGTIDVVLTGDIMLGRRLEPLIERDGINYPFDGIAQSINTCPIIFGNLEAPFVYEENVPKLKKNGKKPVYLYAEENIAHGFKSAGFNVLSLANNHALDYGQDALKQTMEILEHQGIKYGGIRKGDMGRPNEPVIMEYNGVKVGFLCYSRVSGRSFASGLKKFGTIPGTYKVIKRDVKNARSKVDVLIVYMHWGLEGREVQKRQRVLGRGIIDLGADMVIGSHTHLFQDVEKYKGHYIFYGLGNFIFDMRDDPSKYSAFVKVKVEDKKIKEVRITPVYLKDFRPEIMTDKAEIDKFLGGIKLKDVKLADIYGENPAGQ